MSVERAPTLEPEATTGSPIEQKLGEAILGQAILIPRHNGNRDPISVDHTYRNDHLVNPNTSVIYMPSANIAQMLEGHMEIRELYWGMGAEPPERRFSMFHASSGQFFYNLKLEMLNKRQRDHGMVSHTATFSFTKKFGDNQQSLEYLVVPISEIFCITPDAGD